MLPHKLLFHAAAVPQIDYDLFMLKCLHCYYIIKIIFLSLGLIYLALIDL